MLSIATALSSFLFLFLLSSSLTFITCFNLPYFSLHGKDICIPFQPTITSCRALPKGDIDVDPLKLSTADNYDEGLLKFSTPAATKDRLPFQSRGKVNEIDFCMAPSDVSLSRSYGNVLLLTTPTDVTTDTSKTTNTVDLEAYSASSPQYQPRIISLTRALNNVSNRAVRRILLSRSWPSAEALNLSLRQVLSSDKKNQKKGQQENNYSVTDNVVSSSSISTTTSPSTNLLVQVEVPTAKCPVPRPILNIIMRRSRDSSEDNVRLNSSASRIYEPGIITAAGPTTSAYGKRNERSDQEWIDDQMKAFRDSYGQLSDYYTYADAYLECILHLATTGIESDRVSEVLNNDVYDDSYRRVLSTIKSAGAVFELVQCADGKQRMKIAAKLVDTDICLSILDKIAKRNEKALALAGIALPVQQQMQEKEAIQLLDPDQPLVNNSIIVNSPIAEKKEKGIKKVFSRILAVVKQKKSINERKKIEEKMPNEQEIDGEDIDDGDVEPVVEIKPEDLGAMLLSAEEPTVTRQLNILANVVKRALVFGGDDEILVLYETMEADKPAFIQRWHNASVSNAPFIVPNEIETRPDVQFFNCLVQLLKNCYNFGVVTDLHPPFPLNPSYANAYERLTATLVEQGSGYIKPVASNKISSIPKTASDGLRQFSQWEVAMRKTKRNISDYPSDLIGTWQVKDELGGKTLGTTTVVFKSDGEVYVEPPLKGLRWRVVPGPTHLDTCTFQVLSDDGAILQYRGFLDRGARLESRFSKRPIKIRGAVTFQMRDGDYMGDDYKRDMLPLIIRTGTTRFLMTKVFDLHEDT